MTVSDLRKRMQFVQEQYKNAHKQKNILAQIESGVPVTIAVPAWLREDGEYERMDILDDINDMGYNVNNKSREGLLYHRDNQVVARDIIILRKK